MATKCSEQISRSSIDIACSTTKCSLPRSDSGQHDINIINNRPGSIYEVEICSICLNGFVDFNGKTKFVNQPGMVGSKSVTPPISATLNPLKGPGSDEIQTVVEFYDATQRGTNNSYIGPKESYQVDYEMDVL